MTPHVCLQVRTGVCAFDSCGGMRCLETRAGKTACVKDEYYPAQNQTIVNTILFDACTTGDLQQVKYILSQDIANINTRGENGMTPIMIATEKGHREIIELLVKKGSDLSLFDEDDNTILHLACKEGNVEIVKHILSQKIIDIESRGENENTPLMFAVQFGNMEVFSFLMKKGANISNLDEDGGNILHFSCRRGNIEILNYILKRNLVDINSEMDDGMTPLLLTAKLGKKQLFQLLIERGAYEAKTHDSKELLNYACEGGDVEIMERVLNLTNVDINIELWDGVTPLLRVAFFGNIEMFKLLVTKGADVTIVDDEEENVLHSACHGGNVEMVKYVHKLSIVDINGKQDKGMTPLFLAAFCGFQTVFEYLVEKGADTSGVDAGGDNILHLACRGENVEIVKYVLTQNMVDINSKGVDGMTPVLVAAFLGKRAVFEYLVKKGADTSGVDAGGDNILHLACRGENVEIVKYVLTQNMVDINSKGVDGMTPVLVAAFLGKRAVFEYLVKKGADTSGVDAGGDNILHLACRGENVEIVKYVLTQNMVDINSKGVDGLTPVLVAAFLGYRAVFVYLVEIGADTSRVDDTGNNILHLACRGDNVEMVKYLHTQNMVDINSKGVDGMTPVLVAAFLGKRAVFEYLVEKGADTSVVDSDGNNILHLACRGDKMEMVKYLLTQNMVDINSKGVDGMTPVLMAVYWGYRAVFEYLLEKGADTSRVDSDGNNILHIACRGENVEIVKYVLTQNMVDINSKGVDGMTPVLVAAYWGYRAVFEYLVEKGADTSVVDADGNNILHIACRGENVEIVKYVLTQNMVDINSKGVDGMTPVLVAAYWGYRAVFEYLVEKGADTSGADADGDNILHIACRGENVEIVKYLLTQNMVDINSKGVDGMTPVLVRSKTHPYLSRKSRVNLVNERSVNSLASERRGSKPETAPFRIALPFIGKASHIISRLLKQQANIDTHFTSSNSLNALLRANGRNTSKPQETKGVVYKIDCNCGQSYSEVVEQVEMLVPEILKNSEKMTVSELEIAAVCQD
ncbi:ankyrin-3-like [Haliotis cracherodii]|uniref:ankyrin-3-like n=1 Tax=Haliotis cracherodii TaxID=6455 RepID=UPI0039EC77EA